MGWDFWDWAFGNAYKANQYGLQKVGIDQPTFTQAAKKTPETAVKGVANALGFVPNVIDKDAPGASLDTAGQDAEREKMRDLLEQLQQQAATGSGSWEGTLQKGIEQSQAASSSLGQAQANAGGNYGSSLMNIGNAQSAAAQRGVGESDVLRERSKLSAQNELGDLLGTQAGSDINEAAERERVERERRNANQTLIDQSLDNRKNTEKGIESIFHMNMSGMSDGGRVPGKPQFGGDDPRNDTVTAKLTPKEVVLPLSVTQAPDAPQRAAEFMAAIQAGHDPSRDGVHFDEGGGIRPVTDEEAGGAGTELLNVLLPHVGRKVMYDKLRQTAGAGGGGELDRTNYNETKGRQDALAPLISERANGGESAAARVGQQRATDEMLGAAQAESVNGRRSNADVMQTAAAGGAGAAGDAAGRQLGYQNAGQADLGKLFTQTRGQEARLASAAQQAAWEKTLSDAGVTLQNQAELRGVIAGAGQAAAAFAGAGPGGSSYTASPNNLTALANNPYPYDTQSWETPDFNNTEGPGDDFKTGMFLGGAVPYADGGEVEDSLQLEDTGRTIPLRSPRHTPQYVERRKEDKQEHDKAAEYEEETGSKYRPSWHRKPPPKEEGSMLSRAGRAVQDFAKSLSAQMPHLAGGGEVPPMTWPDGTPLTPAEVAAVESGAEPTRAPPPSFNTVVTPSGTATMPPAAPLSLAGVPKGDAPKPYVEENPRIDFGSHEALAEGQRLGVRPRAEATPAEPAAPAVPIAPAPRPAGGGVALPPSHGLEEGFAQNEAQLAGEHETAAAVEQARAEKAGADAKVAAQAAGQLEMKAANDRARQQTQEAMTRWSAAQEEFARINATVDPGRFWNSRTTGQKVMGWIGMALGALGTGPDGINHAAQMMNKAIDRDIEAQKAEHELKLRHGTQKLAAAQTFYSMAREAGHDDIAATELAKAAALESAALRADQLVAGVKEPLAKAKGMALSAALRSGALEKQKEAEQKTFENRVKNQMLNIEAAKASAHGTGLGEGERKELHDVTAAAAEAINLIGSVRNTLKSTRSAIPGKTAINQNFGDDAARLDTDVSQLIVKLKDINKLGQIGPGDKKLLEEAIGDPKAIFTWESTKNAKLDQLERIIRSQVATQRAARGVQ